MTINAVVGNSSLGEYTISSNDTITLNRPEAEGVKIGFNYIPILETMPVDREIDDGPLTAHSRRISRCYVNLYDSLNLTIQAADAEEKKLVVQQIGFDSEDDLDIVEGNREFNFLGYDKNPTITISQSDPLKLKILGLAMELVFAWVHKLLYLELV